MIIPLYFSVPRRMPSSNENCLFHADRVKFDILEKEIKRSKLIPRTCIHRLASAICSCRTELGMLPKGSTFINSKASNQPAHKRSLIRAFASRLSIL